MSNIPLSAHAFRALLRDELNDRFEHYEKRTIAREEQQHQEIMSGFAETIASVNDHIDERFDRLEKLLSLDREVRTLSERFAELAKRTGNTDLAAPAPQPVA